MNIVLKFSFFFKLKTEAMVVSTESNGLKQSLRKTTTFRKWKFRKQPTRERKENWDGMGLWNSRETLVLKMEK
jgi:hypothetical protein